MSPTEANPHLPILLHLREALKTPPEKRLQEMTEMIIQMLMHTKGLSEYLRETTQLDLKTIANTCSLIHISQEEILALREETIDCCFIILKGMVYSRKLRREDIGDRLDSDQRDQERPGRKRRSTTNYIPKIRRIQEFSCGKFVGGEYWRGRTKWKYDIVSCQDTTLCILPIHSLTRYVGYMGQIPQDVLQCFWKYHSIYHEIDSLSQQLSVLHNADIDLTREYTERGHMRSYRPGELIFSQGFPRHFLYIVTLGECEYSRTYPEPNPPQIFTQLEAKPSQFVEINTGLVLSSGHFSFMDGCQENEIQFREGEDNRQNNQRILVPQERSAYYYELLCNNATERYWGRDLWHIHSIYSLDEVSKRRIIAYRQRFIESNTSNPAEEEDLNPFPSDDVCETAITLFGTHVNSLIAKTYCEVCVLPLKHIYHCPAMFNKLLKISTRSYPLAAISYKDLLQRYDDTLKWEIDKREITSNIIKLSSELHTHSIKQSTSGHKSRHLQRYLLSSPRYWNTHQTETVLIEQQQQYGQELQRRREEYRNYQRLQPHEKEKRGSATLPTTGLRDVSKLDSNHDDLEEERSFFTTQETPYESSSLEHLSHPLSNLSLNEYKTRTSNDLSDLTPSLSSLSRPFPSPSPQSPSPSPSSSISSTSFLGHRQPTPPHSQPLRSKLNKSPRKQS